MKRTLYILISLLSVCALAMPPQDDKTAPKRPAPKAQPKLAADEEPIPDSLLHPRWRIKKTAPLIVEDLDTMAADLRMPDNIRQEVEYDDSLNMYLVGSKIGDSYLNAPVMMTPDEYRKWSERRAMQQFFRQKDAENVAAKGKEKFSFTDMKFDLGPAEKIFGPGGVRPMKLHAGLFRERGVPYLFDPGQAGPLFTPEELRDFADGADACAFSDFEAEYLEKVAGLTPEALSLAGKTVYHTHGEKGSTVWLAGGERVEVEAVPAKAVDPVGAGDAYRGGLLFARERNLSPVVGARIGTVLGSLKVAVRGAQNWRTTPDDVRGVYASHWGEAPF